MQNKNGLYIFGDSWSDEDWPRLQPEKPISVPTKWSAHVAEMLKLDYDNFAKSGAGNWRISQKVMEQLLLEDVKPDCVMILWSEAMRVPIGNKDIKPRKSYSTQQQKIYKNREGGTWHVILERHMSDVFTVFHKQSEEDTATQKKLYDTLRSIHLDHIKQILFIAKLLEEKDIPYIMAQGYHPHTSASTSIPTDAFNQVWGELVEEYNDKIPKNVIGWPFVQDFGGWNMAEKLHDDMWADDYHPNEKGHFLIADEMLKGYEKMYGK